MSTFREIVTKTIVGKCKKNNVSTYKIECDEKPNTILGCWVINHKFNGVNMNNKVGVNGSFDVNVWYSYDNDTKTGVVTKNFNYNDLINVNLKNGAKLDKNSEIIVEALKQPTVTDVSINDGLVDLKVEKELGVEVIGNATVRIQVEDDIEEYEEIVDLDEDELNIDVDNVNEEYINEKN